VWIRGIVDFPWYHRAPRLFVVALKSVSLLLSLPVRALKRTIGVSSDIRTQETFRNCIQGSNNTYHVDFEYGGCPNLIACMMNNLPADLTAGMQAGGNIASLVPTILALVGV
jgi:hypothetical protein